jgi:uncharacterized protein
VAVHAGEQKEKKTCRNVIVRVHCRFDNFKKASGLSSMAIAPQIGVPEGLCRILSLDGGGAKGFYTLGVLAQVEALVKKPLCEHFHLIFGTSTGAIIAALLCLGYKVEDILSLYRQHLPAVMKHRRASGRTKALDKLALEVFADRDFSAVKTGVGIVATHWDLQKPMIFKTSIAQAHGQEATFLPGFGCKLREAVRASCSAYPFFERFILKTGQGLTVELFDGGYCGIVYPLEIRSHGQKKLCWFSGKWREGAFR